MEPPDHPEVASPADRGTIRTVVHEGESWTVWEGRLGQFDRRSGPHLFFESASVVRRVRTYPPNWRALPDAELMALAEGR